MNCLVTRQGSDPLKVQALQGRISGCNLVGLQPFKGEPASSTPVGVQPLKVSGTKHRTRRRYIQTDTDARQRSHGRGVIYGRTRTRDKTPNAAALYTDGNGHIKQGGHIMGWAKYAEDNYEIYLERIYYRSAKVQQPQIKITTVIPSVVPAKIEISVQSSEESDYKREPDYKDLIFKCCDCGRKFLFSTGEQKFYESRSFDMPKRCKPCRQINKKLAERRFWSGLL